MRIDSGHKTGILILIAISMIVTLFAFLPCLQNGYCNWDDYHLITANKSVKELSWKTITQMFTSDYVGTYIPLTVLSFAIEHKIFGLKPFVSHSINLLLHILNVALVFLLIYKLTRNPLVSFIVSILFGIHPLRVESVAWATERKDMLYSFFFLAGMLAYVYYRKNQFKKYLFISLTFFVLSVLSKPMAVTLPAVLILVDYYFEKKFTLKQINNKIPFLIPALLFGIINIHFQGSHSLPIIDYLKHFFVFCYNILFYLYKILMPLNLSCFYPYPNNFENTLPLVFLVSPLIVAGLVLVVVLSGKITHKIIFGTLLFVITILPVSQIVPLIAPAIAADRYTYIPAIGLFYIAGISFIWLFEWFRNRRIIQGIMVFFFFVLLSSYAMLSNRRCGVWKDSITLWNDVLQKFPESGLAYNNRGSAYNLLGEYDKAIADLDKAIPLSKESADSYFNRGTAYEHLGQYEKAIEDYTEALRVQSDFAIGYVNRGALFCRMGAYDKAHNDLTRALKLNPNLAEAYYNLGVLFFQLKNYNLAIEQYDRALKIDPYLSGAYVSRADIYFINGDHNLAIEYYTKALMVDSLYVDAYYNRAIAFTQIGQLERALADYDQTIILNPRHAQAYNNRGNIYLRYNSFDEALADYGQAITFDSNYAQAYYNRAVAYYKLGMFDSALKDVAQLEKLGVVLDSHFVNLLKVEK